MAKKLVNPFENKGKKKLITANDMFESVRTPLQELEKIVNMTFISVNRNAAFQELQGIVSIYERNVSNIITMVQNSKKHNYSWTVDEFVEACLKKFDYMNNVLIDNANETEQSKKLNAVSREYVKALFTVHISVYLEDDENLKTSYKAYKDSFEALTFTFMDILRESAIQKQKANQEKQSEEKFETKQEG